MSRLRCAGCPIRATEHPQVTLATFADAVVGADVVVNATGGSAAVPALQAAGAEALAGNKKGGD